MKNPEKVSKHIVQWIKNYLKNSGANGIVIGISGGVDSALTSTLCAETKSKVLCLEMPIHQNIDQVSRSKKHIEWLKNKYSNVSSLNLSLDKIYESFIDIIPETKSINHELSLANTRSRFRMATLYYFSALNNFIVVGTGNKVEDFGVGFYTKYGDGGVDISPIADLLKSEVFYLAKYHKIIIEILEAEPNDGLWNDNRSDEDQIGASYDEIEEAMKNIEIGNEVLSIREQQVIKIFKSFHDSNKHKMIPIPVCIIPKDYL